MKDSELQFDRTCHVLYSKPCKKEILAKIALHYPEAEREAAWEKVQRQYVEFLSDWRTDLGGKQNFHNGAGGTYDCIAIMSYYVACKAVTSFREIEEMEENLILPSFRKLKFVDCNKPFFRKLMYKAFLRAKSACDKWHDYEMDVASRPGQADLLRIHSLPGGGVCHQARSYRHHARPVQRGFCVHGVDPRKTGAHHHLCERLQMRLYDLRRQRPVSEQSSRIPRRGRIQKEQIGPEAAICRHFSEF